jgi:DNA-binding response OmpR family regulator
MAKKLLVIDDQDIFRKRFVRSNQNLSPNIRFDILEAEDGMSGLEIFAANEIDFMIVDVHMPNMNGIEMLEKLHEEHKEKIDKTKVFMITTEGDEKAVKKGRQLGVTWIMKPINVDKFFDLITDEDF